MNDNQRQFTCSLGARRISSRLSLRVVATLDTNVTPFLEVSN